MSLLSTKEYREAIVAALSALSDEEVDEMAFEWGPNAIAPTIVAAREIAARARRLVGLLEIRYARERPSTMYAAPDGKRYVLRTPRERELTDATGLRNELSKTEMDGYQRQLFERAFSKEPATWKANHTVLNQMSDRSKEAREVIRSFRGWKYRPPQLELLDEAGEKQDGS